MATRNEVIYQSVVVGSSPVTGAALDSGDIAASEVVWAQRVTDMSFAGETTRTDINCFGQLASLAREIIDEPTVSFDFSYYLANAFNESGALGMTAYSAAPEQNLISGILSDEAGQNERNYYILTVPQGNDANTIAAPFEDGDHGVVGVGNAFMTQYTVNLSVGDIPNASVSFEAANLTFATGDALGVRNPAIIRTGVLPSIQYTGSVKAPTYTTDDDGDTSVAALGPGDITLDFGAGSLAAGGVILDGNTEAATRQAAHVQSVSIDVPLSRTPLTKLGSPFAFSRKLDVPINVQVSVTANVGDLVTGSLVDLVCAPQSTRDITVTLNEKCGGAGNMVYKIKGCELDSQSMSLNVGDSETVDLTFSAQIGGANDQVNGVFLSGALNP